MNKETDMLLSPKVVYVPAQREIDADVNEWGYIGLKCRAAFGRAGVEAADPDHESVDATESAVDAIVNVLHWLGFDERIENPTSVLETARMHYEAEKDGEPFG